MGLHDISKEELDKQLAFRVAVSEGLKRQPEGKIVLINCPCGGKIKAIHSEYNGHRTTIAVCNKCKRRIKGSIGALNTDERR